MSTVIAGIKFGIGLTIGTLAVSAAISPIYLQFYNKAMKSLIED